jgi:hypothetical protein
MSMEGEDNEDDELQDDELKEDDFDDDRHGHDMDDIDEMEDPNRYQPLKRRASTGTLLIQARAQAVCIDDNALCNLPRHAIVYYTNTLWLLGQAHSRPIHVGPTPTWAELPSSVLVSKSAPPRAISRWQRHDPPPESKRPPTTAPTITVPKFTR